MKIFVCFVIFAGLAFPVFSQQSENMQRFRALSETMDRSISRSTDTLDDFDSRSTDDGNVRMFSWYRNKHTELVTALRASEIKMERFFRTNDRVSYIREERNNYERLLTELEATKAEYDNWLKTVQ